MDKQQATERANDVNLSLPTYLVAIPMLIGLDWYVVVKELSEIKSDDVPINFHF